MISRSLALVAVLALTTLLCVSADPPVSNTIVFEFQQVGRDVVLTVEGTLGSQLPDKSSTETPSSACFEPLSSFSTSTGIFAVCVSDGTLVVPYPLTLVDDVGPFTVTAHSKTGIYTGPSGAAFDVNLGSGDANAMLYALNQEDTFSATATFEDETLDDFITGATGLLATFTIDGHGGTVEIRIAEPDRVLGDPHFFVGRSLYDWKQVGVYDHLVFADHAVTLDVEDFAGCDGEMSGEFILGLSVSGSSWTAACDGIYDANTGELVAKHRFTLTTPCVTATVLLTNGYLNLHNITTSCKVEGGVHKAMTDHASSNVDGWWEWTEAGGFELKDKAVPKLTPLVKKPRVISIDI